MKKSIHSKAHETLTQWLIDGRNEAGLTQRDLAARLDVHHSIVGKIETGERRLDVIELIEYCDAISVDPEDAVSLVKNI